MRRARAGRRAAPLVVGGVGRRRELHEGTRARAFAVVRSSAGTPIEVVTPTGPGVDAQDAAARDRDACSARELDLPGLLDESAGRHARRTAWRWSAGAGVRAVGAAGRAGTSSTGCTTARAGERTVWVDGEPHEVGRAAASTGSPASATCASRALATRAKRENYLVIASDYEQPFGTFTGSLPGRGRAAQGWGVMERHEGAVVILAAARAASRRSRAAVVATACSGGARRARRRGGAARVGALSWSDAVDEARALAPTLIVLASLLVLGDGCERAGLFDALAARLARARAGRGPRLLTLVVGAAAAVTAVLGLDATVVLLTPAAFAAAAQGAAERAARTSTRARTWPTRRRCCCRSRTSRTCSRSARASSRSRTSRR